jgi:hypothetical protein
MDDWFANKPDPNGDASDECLLEQSDALKDYLHGHKDASEAAQVLTHATATSNSPKDEVSRLYVFLLDTLVGLPSEHIIALLDLLRAIEDQPEPKFISILDAQRLDMKLWKGLPGFATLWSDVGYRSGSWKMDAEATTGAKRDNLRVEHVRKAHAEAQLSLRGLAGVPIGWGYEVVDDALGDEALLDFEVPAAAEWFETCGSRFRQGAENEEKSYVFEGGMSMQRWDKWEKRLKELREDEGVVGRAATKALEAMHKAYKEKS